ncbi:MAG: polyphosphate polymerase domain-containing protein [Bacteroidota bacterium]
MSEEKVSRKRDFPCEITSRRFERKYEIEHFTPALVEQYISLHPAGFRRLFPDRVVNNIYFDTPNLLTFHQNIAGVNQRSKFRLRWYGKDYQKIEKSVFEVKMKHNELGSKQLYKLGAMDWKRTPQLHQDLLTLAPEFAVLRPSLYNCYLRSYFGTPNGKFRITIDRKMRFAMPSQRPSFHLTNNNIIVEVKYKETEDQAADFILQHLPFRSTKSSKYVTGMLLTTES